MRGLPAAEPAPGELVFWAAPAWAWARGHGQVKGSLGRFEMPYSGVAGGLVPGGPGGWETTRCVCR